MIDNRNNFGILIMTFTSWARKSQAGLVEVVQLFLVVVVVYSKQQLPYLSLGRTEGAWDISNRIVR